MMGPGEIIVLDDANNDLSGRAAVSLADTEAGGRSAQVTLRDPTGFPCASPRSAQAFFEFHCFALFRGQATNDEHPLFQ